MGEKGWPISRVDKDDGCLIGISQRLGDGIRYSKDTFDSFPSLEETVGENWQSTVLAALLEKDRLIAWRTSTRVFKKSGLRRYRTDKLPDQLDISSPPKNLSIRRFFFGGTLIYLVGLNRHRSLGHCANHGPMPFECKMAGSDIPPAFICPTDHCTV